MVPFINIGPLALPTKALVLIVGAWLSLTTLEAAGAKVRGNVAALSNAGFAGLVVGFVGARLAFVVSNWSTLAGDWLALVWPLTAGYVPWVGWALGGFALALWLRARRAWTWVSADALTPALVVGLMAMSFGDYVGGPGYGTVSSGRLFERHPVQLYEVLVGLAALAVWWAAQRRPAAPGTGALLTVVAYGLGIVLVTPWRGNTWVTAGGWLGVQWLGLLAALLALGIAMARLPSDQDRAEA